ncbi:glycosyltransferase family 2 protein [Streptomyces sp. ODS05-4]|uniref:glycosyltransferase family 2 protein n=1 Tax=Streptomyces sp. ODS05-4 TaxID=2944939 RepID=UPI00210E5D66|nr:glycosyltransferase family 2 protein [Streptomyces sp. ODS05-4]
MVKLSVVVPFYNVQTYASDTLLALRADAREDVEFLLVDDCSTDRTPDILRRAARELPGARLLTHEVNKGLASARNTGIDAARGEYLAFLDGDDWTAPGHFTGLLAAIEHLGCDFVRTDHMVCTGKARKIARVPVGRRNTVLEPRAAILPADRSTSVDYPYAWAGMYHRRLAERGLLHFTDGLRTAEDRPWIWKLHREAESFAVTGPRGVPGGIGLFYRRGVATSLTQIGDARQLDFLRAFDQVLGETAADPDAATLLPKAVRTYCAIIAHHLGNADRFEPAVLRQLRVRSGEALRRMPQDVLAATLDAMDADRAARLRRVRRRAGAPPASTGVRTEVAAA